MTPEGMSVVCIPKSPPLSRAGSGFYWWVPYVRAFVLWLCPTEQPCESRAICEETKTGLAGLACPATRFQKSVRPGHAGVSRGLLTQSFSVQANLTRPEGSRTPPSHSNLRQLRALNRPQQMRTHCKPGLTTKNTSVGRPPPRTAPCKAPRHGALGTIAPKAHAGCLCPTLGGALLLGEHRGPAPSIRGYLCSLTVRLSSVGRVQRNGGAGQNVPVWNGSGAQP